MGNEEKDIIDILMDDDNHDPIPLYTEGGEEVLFDQVAVIPYNDRVYAILAPLTPFEDIGVDDCLVFYVDEDENTLVEERSDKVAQAVYDIYIELLDDGE
ncbi:MAG: DUF1292 domain-containing protein [Clostridia bacterium]|nr:DUF1292 domain-containing protein [Clostridia bacterium]